ncbi:MAG: tRNA dihydrouridine synthase DusB [Lactobacillales bacterium]|jgi:nifR3 family TIM-barrel protein|nr:tRNA dihydrouridine synthase DusB [Lactobacillales bacterium]
MEKTWKIGGVEIPNRIVIAPMAGITNGAFRHTLKDFGAGLVVTEMVSDKAIHYRNAKTLDMLKIEENEHPISVQLFGGEIASLVEAAQYVEENTSADIIDINMGCPVNKVIRADAGSVWLRDPEKIHSLGLALKDAIDLPYTFKMRLGWDANSININENAIAAQAGGVSALALHGRTRSQMYEGHADWEKIAEIADLMKIPFIGNGDVRSPEEALKMITEVGCDAVMIGRAVMGNPWMIKRCEHYLATGELIDEPSAIEKIAIAKTHLDRLILGKGHEKAAVHEFRQHAAHYLKGIPNTHKVKVAIMQTNTREELVALLDEVARDEK